jgi:uncharacterized protein YlxW (UPF0749 family)
MTDQHEPEKRAPEPPRDRGMPAAGRKPDPAPAAQPSGAEGPTVPVRRPVAPAADQPPAGEATVITPPPGRQEPERSTWITRPPGEERTVVTPPRGPDDETTKPLNQPPAADRTAPSPPRPATGSGPAGSPHADGPPSGDLVDEGEEGLSPRAGPAVDEEPTVESLRSAASRPPDHGGETVRLRPPTVVTGPVGEPGAPAESVPEELRASRIAPAEPAPAEAAASPVTQDTSAPVEPPSTSGAAGTVEPPAAPGVSSGEGSMGAPETAGPEAVSPDPVISSEDAATLSAGEADAVPDNGVDRGKTALRRRLSSAGTLIWVLLALFGFTLVVQLRSNNGDEGLATARQEDLVRILSDLEARDQRLQAEITALEQSQRQLTSGVQGRQAAIAEAEKRANELGLLAGTLPGRGPGLRVTIDPKGQVKASGILNAVQELRGAGGEVMEIAGAGGTAVRIVASTYFIDGNGGGIVVDGTRLNGPYTLWVIGVPQTMQTALQIPGGVVASVSSAGGSVTMEARSMVEVTAVRKPTGLQYARPVS